MYTLNICLTITPYLHDLYLDRSISRQVCELKKERFARLNLLSMYTLNIYLTINPYIHYLHLDRSISRQISELN